MPWLTGNAPSGAAVCRTIFVPDEPTFRAAVRGALLEMTYEYNWEQEGDLTPAEAAALAFEMLETYEDLDCGSGGGSGMVGAIVFVVDGVTPLPENILLCDGSVMLREDWPELYQFFVDTSYPFIIDADSATLPEFTPETTTWVGLGSTDMLYAIVAG